MPIYEPVCLVLLFDELKNVPTFFGYNLMDIHFYFAESIFSFVTQKREKLILEA